MDDLAMNIMLKKPPVTMYTQKELLCINKGSERSNSLRGLAEGWRSSRLTAERKNAGREHSPRPLSSQTRARHLRFHR